MRDSGLWFVRASITTVPLLGLLLTVFGMINSFIGCGGERSICMAAVVERLARSIVPASWGILLATIQLVFYMSLPDTRREPIRRPDVRTAPE